MVYIWINPVTASMYDNNALDEFLYHNGYERFAVETDWISIVREKYKKAVEKATGPVMDVRCPKIKKLLDEMNLTDKVEIPDIAPILIHCGQEMAFQVELKNVKKVITTPCQALANMGNALEMADTWFVPWKTFLKNVGTEPEGVCPQKSPIPSGFFDDLNLHMKSVSGEKEIRECLKREFLDKEKTDIQLVEMLFCEGGCHNGDGIRRDEDEGERKKLEK